VLVLVEIILQILVDLVVVEMVDIRLLLEREIEKPEHQHQFHHKEIMVGMVVMLIHQKDMVEVVEVVLVVLVETVSSLQQQTLVVQGVLVFNYPQHSKIQHLNPDQMAEV